MCNELVEQIMNSHNDEGIHYIKHLFKSMLGDMKHTDVNKYHTTKCELYKYAYGNHLSEKFAKDWVSKMKNEDGTIGGHWKVEETEGVNTKSHNKWDWYATLNMMYSDYYNPKFTTNDYIYLANKFLDDKDASDDKLLEYYFHIVDKEQL